MPSKQSSRKRQLSRGERLTRDTRRHIRLIVFGVLLIAAGAALVYFSGPAEPLVAVDAEGREVQTGPRREPGAAPRRFSPAPNFVLADYEGRAVSLEQFRGKVVFLNFWATWCTACAAEMPDMNRLAKAHPDSLVVLAVNRGEKASSAKKWSDARSLEHLVFAIDPTESISGLYKLPNNMPVGFFIGADGVVTHVIQGAQNLTTMERNYQESLATSGASRPAP